MMKIRKQLLSAIFLLTLGSFQGAIAATITSSLGNTAPGFADGSTQPVFLVGGAQGGQPAPFDQGYGTDGLFGGNFFQSWVHTYDVIVNPILNASITIGIYDHDSAASGSQLLFFDFDGTNLGNSLDSMFEAGGGVGDSVYSEYTINLDASMFGSLADGSAFLALALAGPGLVPNLFGGGFQETSTNGANLIFSSLNIEFQDGPSPIPVPAAAPLFASALALMGLYRRRVLRNQEKG